MSMLTNTAAATSETVPHAPELQLLDEFLFPLACRSQKQGLL